MEQGTEFFLLFIVPIIGLGLHCFLSPKNILRILIASIILFTPAIFGYSYIISFVYIVLAIICFACLFTFFLETFKSNITKFILSVVISGFLFFFLGLYAFMHAFAGSTTVEKKWELDQYKIEYIRDQGFSGGALMKYELRKYGFVPLFIKYVETTVDEDTTNSCLVRFKKTNILFDKCSGKIIK